MKHLTKILAVGFVFAASAPFALATPITPGGLTVAPAPITTLGTVATLATTGPVTIVSNGAGNPSTFTVTYTESVVTSSVNPFGAGDLVFVMTFTNSTGSRDALERATNGAGFAGFLSDVAYLTGSGVTPLSADENNAGTIGFNFGNVAAGQSSDTFVVFTNAHFFQSANFSVIDSQTATGLGFAPAVSAVPEPSSLILLGTGLISAAGAALRKRRAL